MRGDKRRDERRGEEGEGEREREWEEVMKKKE